jgi:hypothetical protein
MKKAGILRNAAGLRGQSTAKRGRPAKNLKRPAALRRSGRQNFDALTMINLLSDSNELTSPRRPCVGNADTWRPARIAIWTLIVHLRVKTSTLGHD